MSTKGTKMDEIVKDSSEAISRGVELSFEAQQKAEELYGQSLAETFDAAQGGLKQYRQFVNSMQLTMPWTASLQPAIEVSLAAQEKALDAAKKSALAAFETYRKTMAEPSRHYARQALAKMAEKTN